MELNVGQVNIKTHVKGLYKDCEKNPFYIFIQAPAGCGKSTLLLEMKKDAIDFFGSQDACLVTAPTNATALLVKGKTIHAAFGISPKESEAFKEMSKATYARLRKMLKTVKVIFLDEISMVSALLFAQMCAQIQIALASNKPFGGISIVLFGDLLQLEPVGGNAIYEEIPEVYKIARDTMAPCPVSHLWTLVKTMKLHKNMRTEDELEASVLKSLQEGIITEEAETFLNRYCRIRNTSDAGIFQEVDYLRRMHPEADIAVLATHNAVVNRLNEMRIRNMEGCQTVRWMTVNDGEQINFKTVEYKVRPLMLAPGCRVILTDVVNIREGLVKGTRGLLQEIKENHITVSFPIQGAVRIDRMGFKKMKKDGGEFLWKQYPVREAEVITIHNSQGQTFDGVVIVPDELFAKGLMYTAISRARNLKMCRISNIRMESWEQSESAKGALQNLKRKRKE